MRQAAILALAVFQCVFSSPTALRAQEPLESLKITVTGKEVTNGVVILTVQDGQNSFELRCNKDLSGCTILQPGEYMMVRLPKNRGLYDCANAEVYRKSANSEVGEKLGQYCMVESK
ncbi:MAG TPA: hypothetical protein VFV92_03760 [Candidatus Bathyarchaeia archaeon]|nr:hypothetical protein [Candidatus Bathyarchaeia archaeon]